MFWTRLVAGAALLCLTLAVVLNWKKQQGTIEATEFLLKDRSGNIAARLAKDNTGETCLTLSAKADVAVASLCVQDKEGSSLDLHNLKSESRASLTPGYYLWEPHGHLQPALIINDSWGTNHAYLNVGNTVALSLGHGAKDSIKLSSPAEKPSIVLLGGDEKPIWSTK